MDVKMTGTKVEDQKDDEIKEKNTLIFYKIVFFSQTIL